MCSYKPAIVGLGGIGKYRRCHEGLVRPPLESDGWRLDSTLTYWRSSYSKPSFWMRQWWIGGASLTLLLGRASSEDESLVDEIVMPSLLMIGAYAGRGPVKSRDSVTCTRTIGWHTRCQLTNRARITVILHLRGLIVNLLEWSSIPCPNIFLTSVQKRASHL